MRCNDEWKAALAAIAAPAGIIFSSGQGMVFFFTQTGWTSWLGITLAAALFGFFCGMICRMWLLTGSQSLTEAYERLFSSGGAVAIRVLHGAFSAAVVLYMCSICGSVAAITVPLHNAFLMGCAASGALALLLNMKKQKRMSWMGLAVVVVCGVICTGMAMDPREVTIYQCYEVEFKLFGSIGAAVLLAMLFAAVCVLAAARILFCFAGYARSGGRVAWKCGALMLMMLAPANAALMRGGEKLLVQKQPMVLLAARWGRSGFYICAAMMWICAVSTLAAVLATVFDVWQVKSPKSAENMTKNSVKL